MKILQVSTQARVGGAGIAAHRLHTGLRSLGADSWMLVNKTYQAEEHVLAPARITDKVLARLAPKLDLLPGRFSKLDSDRISSAWVPSTTLTRIRQVAPDILNLHWINDGFIRLESLKHLRRPVVWTLHDMWAFSGAEHYHEDARRYQEGCSATNRPAAQRGWDVNRWVWKRKMKAWSALKDMVIVTPSQWLGRCAAQSALFRDNRVEVLANGVDHRRFHPLDRSVARDILGLPADKKIILFGAGSATSDKRKGFHLLVEALKQLETQSDSSEYALAVFGALSGDTDFSIETTYLGKLQDEISMALVYAAADVFVAPSIQENLANTVLESMACGTPVVAFDIGGMPDMIEHQSSGFLARGFDTGDLAAGIRWVVSDHDRWRGLSARSRERVVQGFTLEHAATRYLELYSELASA